MLVLFSIMLLRKPACNSLVTIPLCQATKTVTSVSALVLGQEQRGGSSLVSGRKETNASWLRKGRAEHGAGER